MAKQSTQARRDGRAENSIDEMVEWLRQAVDDRLLGQSVVDVLLPKGVPHDFESNLWDYKERLPVLAERPTSEDRASFDAELGGIMKDALAFHNAYGGYIVFGVADKGKNRIKGCSSILDCGDFNRRFQAYAGNSIECLFKTFELAQAQRQIEIGLMLVPRRTAASPPVRFVKDGPVKPNGDRTFRKEIYIRVRDECRPAAATSEDWKLLHSDRNPPGRMRAPSRRDVASGLPVRDADLIEFVGRAEPLEELRSWFSDPRSPVRLITGIGGLGKTTLAYRFAEEVAATGAGEIERLIWLTAKQRTFSSLRGKMVDVASVDFVDLETLYQAVLKELRFEQPLEDDEPSLEGLSDRIVEGLSMCPSLIIVDDIDSLDPDRQREIVAALSAIAFGTVRRELAPSRILMTSRIDQGQPPTGVVKISGLEREAFDVHVTNIAKTFGISCPATAGLDELYDATSGSPLFVASILRLVKLGENLRDVVDTWRGQDGEEVRNFAFGREITRLNTAQSRLLYAVLLLGETSIGDLAEILAVTTRAVRDRISELQAYHLIASGGSPTGDTVITAPNDLIAVTAIVRSHLGTSAAGVEESCERALRSTGASGKEVGHGIRQVVAAWNRGEVIAAVALASSLRRRFPKNGDIACLLGRALIYANRFAEADTELEAARRLGCGRVELLDLMVEVKSQLKDWLGLYQLTRTLTSKQRSADKPLDGFLLSIRKLIDVSKSRGDWSKAADYAVEAVERIDAKMSVVHLETNFFERLKAQKFQLARDYLGFIDHDALRPGDKLRVFEGVVRLSMADVVLIDLLRIGMRALDQWWSDVEARPVIDLTACGILRKQLQRLEHLEGQYANYSDSGKPVPADIAAGRRDLEHRGGVVSSRVG